MTSAMDEGIIDKLSHHSVEQTVDRLKNILQSKGVTPFTVIDHSGEPERVGMKMPPTKLLVFGNPKAGTPLMQAAPSSAFDLPFKILIWEDAERKTRLSYNGPEYLQRRHGWRKSYCKTLQKHRHSRVIGDKSCRITNEVVSVDGVAGQKRNDAKIRR